MMHRDKLTHAERVRLEALAQANLTHASSGMLNKSQSIVATATMYELFLAGKIIGETRAPHSQASRPDTRERKVT